MKITKILAIFLLVLACGLAVFAWILGRQPERAVAPVSVGKSGANQHEANQQLVGQGRVQDVVATRKSIAAGQKINADDLKIISLPVAVGETFSTTDDVLGRTAIVALEADTPVFARQLLEGLALQLEPGQRAVSIAVKEPMAAGHHVRPGDFVDVFVTLDAADKSFEVDSQTRLLLARARVLAYGTNTVETAPLTAAQKRMQDQGGNSVQRTAASDEQRQRPQAINTAVLAVQVDEVNRLALAEKYGFLNLALRHPDDLSVPDATLFAALPEALRPVEVKSSHAPLQGMDRAYAGLKLKDLAEGGSKVKVQSPIQKTGQQRTQGQQRAMSSPVRTVEILTGTEVKTVRY